MYKCIFIRYVSLLLLDICRLCALIMPRKVLEFWLNDLKKERKKKCLADSHQIWFLWGVCVFVVFAYESSVHFDQSVMRALICDTFSLRVHSFTAFVFLASLMFAYLYLPKMMYHVQSHAIFMK